jgi:hypothetical protein
MLSNVAKIWQTPPQTLSILKALGVCFRLRGLGQGAQHQDAISNALKCSQKEFVYLTTEASATALAKAIDNAIAKVTAKAWAKELNAPRCLQTHFNNGQPKLVPKPSPK